jgi:hypothetical protein
MRDVIIKQSEIIKVVMGDLEKDMEMNKERVTAIENYVIHVEN